MHNFLDNCKVVHVADPASLTADTSWTAVDTKGYAGVAILWTVGASAELSGSNYIELEVQDGATSSTAACDNADITVYVTGTNTGTAAKIDATTEDSLTVTTEYIGGLRYVKPVVNVTGTISSGIVVGCVMILFNPCIAPAA